ncbi:HD domain-containing phosphohydrolase [Tolumonas osonensis]|uniref:HD-GYP domain-containing protein (C-di-GMP phosphodiesterase class II) n=1 Tax=Tolumonas osonensis TaxID=675874 RepID=A0A841GEK8_9GAMM|nr:HD domain-containing phosphohydrolase [Tolumonas osonensis]MBB6056007.1 HD-GYP domain-containing protein (c-di-GMP phosphodiesterase class II) [Tolumonas osonensis]
MQTQTVQTTNSLSMTKMDLSARLAKLHEIIRGRYDFIDRVSIALYDAKTDLLKTFVSSDSTQTALHSYEARISDVPSLQKLIHSRQSRIVQDMDITFQGNNSSTHTDWLHHQRFLSSYTIPIFNGNTFVAFLFFDSRKPNVFQPEILAFLDVFADLAAHLYLLEMAAVKSLINTVHLATDFARIRDLETGNHLDRMAKYSRLIARGVAERYNLSDEFIEHVHLFAPLHDIGKVGIPDRVLLKSGKLDVNEWDTMHKHVELGVKMIDQMVDDLGLNLDSASAIMRNIVAGHHERGDGSGYPLGLTLEQIPLEARIVAIADVYDALSTARPYKTAWTEEDVITELQKEVAAGRLDAHCVEALLNAAEERLEIQARFADPV